MEEERLIAEIVSKVVSQSVEPVRYYNEASKLVKGAILCHADKIAEFIICLCDGE